jgi:uncharacterized membrane protein YqgA involved in biofilm formation
MPGLGTLLNIATVLAGSAIGVRIGERLPQRTRDLVTDGIGLVTLMVAVLDGASIADPALRRAVGTAAPVLIVLGAVLIGGIAGSLLRIEDRLDQAGAALQRRLTRTPVAAAMPEPAAAMPEPAAAGPAPRSSAVSEPAAAGTAPPRATAAGRRAGTAMAGMDRPAVAAERERFIQGFVTASMIYCVGPLTVLGALQDGLGQGISQYALKSVLDGFTSIALAASLGWGVAAAALTVLVVQGGLTAAAAAIVPGSRPAPGSGGCAVAHRNSRPPALTPAAPCGDTSSPVR